MNNLKLYSEASLNLQLHSPDSNDVILFSAFDIEQSRLFFASSSNHVYSTHLSSLQHERAWSKTSIAANVTRIELDDTEEDDVITAFVYLMEKESLLVGTSKGFLLLHNVDDENATQVVGGVDGGARCVSVSPDGDLVAILTGAGRILVMTLDWDLLYETAIEDGDNTVGDQVLSYVDSTIVWRGDGKYFVTLSEALDSESNLLKKLKVWERNSGELHSVSESKKFMGSVVDWMPSGAKIAAVYDRKKQNECPAIVFYERNGLERSMFSINEQADATVEFLKWNCSSDILAAIVRCGNYDCVKIWHFSNNHWYLKSEFRYPRHDGVRFVWNPTKPLQLVCWTLGGQITSYNFIWNSAVMDDSTALVIDDSKILVTPLSLCLMPPPMYLFSLKFTSVVREFAYYSRNSKNCLAAFLSDGCLCIVELPATDTWEDLEGKEFLVEASSSDSPFGSVLHLIWLDPHKILAVSHHGFSHSNYLSQSSLGEEDLGFYLQEIELTCSEDHVPGLLTCSGFNAKVSSRNSVEETITGIATNPASKGSAFVQFDSGKIYEYVPKLGISRGASKHDWSFSSTCPWMSVVLVGDSVSSRPLLFGLDDSSRLHVSRKIVCNNCSSFSFYSNLADQVITHLIMATKQDLLLVVEISDVLQKDLDIKPENFIHSGKKKREENRNFINIWERGAKVMGVVHGDEAAVLLQPPRGNLECIYPRKLVLASICNALVQRRFRDALLMVRRQRIDFNVLVDYCGWQVFLQSASEFVKQVNNLNHMTEFVCAIKNEDTTETLYKEFISSPSPKDATDLQPHNAKDCEISNKVSSVLQAIRKALEDQLPETPARELCILTTLARSEPPALDEALERIKAIREAELSGSGDERRVSYPSAEEALKHLLWLSDSESVYEAALGLYDLNLAAMVALNSQRDPKEFLPFLQDLEKLPETLMCYKIDLRLQRFEKALKHIVSAGDSCYADSLNLMKKNPQLFALGLQLIADPNKKMQILDAWGDHLTNEKCYEDAAATYLCCSSFEKALKSYRSSGNWSKVLTVAGILKLGKDEILLLANELCEELQSLGKPKEAAKIALEYCGEINNGVSLLITARDWEEALRIALLHTRQDLVTEVKDAALECAVLLIGEFEEGLEKVGKYLARYLALRQRRLLLAAKVQSEEHSMNDLDDDTSSEASSNISGMSAYTTGTRKSSATSMKSNATSRARDARRQRKKGKIRAGSPGEEIALVDHLKGMPPTAEALQELKSLLHTLVMLGEVETARKLQKAGENFQLSHMAAVKLTEDTVSSDTIDEHAQTLERYSQSIRSVVQNSEAFFWRCKVFLSP